jgi:hypothetical protein
MTMKSNKSKKPMILVFSHIFLTLCSFCCYDSVIEEKTLKHDLMFLCGNQACIDAQLSAHTYFWYLCLIRIYLLILYN